ncbi:hypothetical protein [Neobacillus vireti]
MRYFQSDYHEQYGMGAIRVMPGEEAFFLGKIVGSVTRLSS